MKKIAILLAAVTIASAAYAKEVMPMAETEVVAVAQSDMYLNLSVGGDLGATYGKLADDVLTDKTDGFGGEIALEAYKSLTNEFDIGLGLAYQFHADRDNDSISGGSTGYTWEEKGEGVEYDSIPLYLIAKYNFVTNSDIKPYLKANLGYSFNFNSSDYNYNENWTDGSYNESAKTDVDNGLYLALGGGLEYNNFTMDLMYAITKAESKSKTSGSEKYDNDYERVVLSVGYRFDL
jgi:outer membrane protein W